ncbi:hypothetical protein SpCBS45565_g01192 [Spizellomyces sp. 'palustris']|nr:hypothetical protein SpCBS45565_g01192 [Spizellomyces sp. 'palustris']
MDLKNIILLTLYALSTLAAFELILIYTRVKKNITLRVFAGLYMVFGLVIFIGMGITKGEIKDLDPEVCRVQALVLLYVLSMLYILNFFLTFNVWSAVCTSKFRDQERRRFGWFLLSSLVLSLIPTIVVGIMNSQKPKGVGFGPHAVYCTYQFPINGYAYGPLPFNALFVIATLFMIVHAGVQLLIYRQRIDTDAERASSQSKGFSNSNNSSATTRISLGMCYRFGMWGIVFLTIMVCANFRQIRAVIRQEYSESDKEVGVREYAGAIVGICSWLVFGTGRAAWTASTPYVIYSRLRRKSDTRTVDDGYDLRGYYEGTLSRQSSPIPVSYGKNGYATSHGATAANVGGSANYGNPYSGSQGPYSGYS